MEWSYTHNRMMSSLERLLEPNQYVEYYFCCFRARKSKQCTI